MSIEELQRLAEQGDVEAQYYLGIMYSDGDGIQRDYKKGFFWCEKAALQGYPEAQFVVADMYECGDGVERNIEKAIEWYKKAAENDNDDAKSELIRLYGRGKLNNYNIDKYVAWGVNVIKEKYDFTLINGLVDIFKKGFYNIADYFQSVPQYLIELVEKNDLCSLEAFQLIALLFQKKVISEKLYTRIFKIFEQWMIEDVHGEWLLAEMYEKGDIIKQDYLKAFKLYEDAALKGDGDSGWKLAGLYGRGLGVALDHEKEVYWLTQAMKHGSDDAIFNLAYCYLAGDGVRQDYKKAIELFEQYARFWENPQRVEYNGWTFYSETCYILAEIYDQIDNHLVAIKWCEKAIKKDNYKAMLLLGKMKFRAEGGIQNKEEAYEWFLKAAEAVEKEDEYHDYGEPFYYIGEYWFEKGEDKGDSAKSNTNEQQHCYRQAERYYQKAIDYGYNCLYALEKVQRRLNKKIKGEVMERYGRELVGLKLSPQKLLDRIEEDLKKDFGDNWGDLLSNTRAALKSGIFTYVNFIALGKDFYSQLDFSPAVSSLTKSLEIELGRFFHKNYIVWLKKNNVSSTEFSEKQRSIIFVKDNIYYYQDEENDASFSLGAFSHIIDKKREPESLIQKSEIQENGAGIKYKSVINRHIAKYANELFEEDAFTEENREKEIKNYLISLSEDVESIRDKRNPAAHSFTMKKSDAELCGDYLVKVRKLLCGLLKKIKPEYKRQN